MKQHVIHQFAAMLSGLLTEEEYIAFEAHLAACPACRDAHQRYLETIGDLSMFAPPTPPPLRLRDLVLAQFEGGKKYAMHVAEVAQMLGLTESEVVACFDQIDDVDQWQPGPTKGCHLWPVTSPLKAAFCGFIRLEPGATFPQHSHQGKEHLFIIAGGYVDDDGHALQSGDHDIHDDSTVHTITAMQWVPCICALVLERGFRFQ